MKKILSLLLLLATPLLLVAQSYQPDILGEGFESITIDIALKLAESDMIHQRMGVKPILLLDDIFDKLDMNRVESLLSLVYSSNHGQIFITDSNRTRLSQVLDKIDSNYRLFNVCEGEVEVIKG